MKRLARMGFSICLLTNNTNKRLKCFTEPLELPGFANDLKPMARGLKKSMRAINTKPRHTAIIGDQLLSDVWAGKNAGTATILVKPLTTKDLAFVHIKRRIERRLLTRYYGTT